ncbi:MAG: hypothetical protein H6722_29725 [Sandaracinus sp.]|nr:hypothetical protein [Sandaracinus sp.]
MGATYDPRDIQVLEGLDAIRKRPAMFLGEVGDSRTLAACVVQCLCALVHGGARRLIVSVEDDRAFEIVGEEALLSTDLRSVETEFGRISFGGRWVCSRRLMVPDGIPAVTNALCASFEVAVVAEGACARASWRRGRFDTSSRSDATDAPNVVRVRAALDRDLFGPEGALVTAELDELLDDLAVLAAGVRIHRLDARDGTTREFHAPHGLVDRVAARGVRDPLRLRTEQEDGGVLEVVFGWAGDGVTHVDAWNAGCDGITSVALGESLLAALADVLLPPPRHRPFDRGPHAALGANLTRGLVAAIAVDTPKSSLAHVELPTGQILKPALAPYLLARPALLAQLARQIGESPDALAARLSSD